MTGSAATATDDLPLRPVVDAAPRLGLAATPTFALMAWISAVSVPEMTLCSVAPPWAPINDMALMYLLMGLFHLSPWLKLISRGSRRRITQTEGD